MRVWKQWINVHRTTRKTSSGRWKVTSARDDRHLLDMVVNDRTTLLQAVDSTLVYCYRCTNVRFVNSSTSAAPWVACKGVFIQDPLRGKSSMAASAMSS
ncbi:uncharacterized protein TNCV_1464571 [Trichonephila clavipes]|nr:uncharacterized protein TNCV_1464571 [Trichonephila clavipes]